MRRCIEAVRAPPARPSDAQSWLRTIPKYQALALIDYFELHAAALARAAGAHDRPQRTCDPALATDHLAQVVLGDVLFCHATPRNDEEIFTRISPDDRWRAALDGVEADVVVCGHTHIQFDRRIDDIRLINAGSVGMPYEHEPGAYWALLGPDVELRRTPYAPADIAASGWPDEWPAATPEEATEFFERASRERA